MLKEVKKQEVTKQQKEIADYVAKVKEENENTNAKIENIRLKKLIETINKENKKLPKAKGLVKDYQKLLDTKEKEIKKLKENNEELYMCLEKIPKFIRKVFLKDTEIKMLK